MEERKGQVQDLTVSQLEYVLDEHKTTNQMGFNSKDVNAITKGYSKGGLFSKGKRMVKSMVGKVSLDKKKDKFSDTIQEVDGEEDSSSSSEDEEEKEGSGEEDDEFPLRREQSLNDNGIQGVS